MVFVKNEMVNDGYEHKGFIKLMYYRKLMHPASVLSMSSAKFSVKECGCHGNNK